MSAVIELNDNGEAARLAALRAYEILDTAPEAGFDDIVLLASQICHTPVAIVSLVDRDRQWFKARLGFEACETPLGQSVCVHALQQRDLMVITDLTADPRTHANPLVTGEPEIRFYAGAPLITPTGVVIGTLCVIDTHIRPEGLTTAQGSALEALARMVITQLELRRTLAESEREAEHLRMRELRWHLTEEAGRLGTFELDIGSSLMTVSAHLCRLFGLPVASHYPASAFEELILPEDRHLTSDDASRAAGSAVLEIEYRIRRRDDGAIRWMFRRADFLLDANGRAVTMFGAVMDVTDRRKTMERKAALLELGERLREIDDADEIERAAAEIAGRTLGASAVGFAILTPDGEALSIERGWTAAGAASIVGLHKVADHGGYGEALRDGDAIVVEDTELDARTRANSAMLRTLGARAFIAQPVMDRGRFAALIYVGSDAPRVWTKGEIDFAQAVADRTHAARARLRAEADQRLLNEEIGHRLKNVFAMVQAIATQTLRPVTDREPVKALERRILALSSAHELLLDRNRLSADMRVVVMGILGTVAPVERFDVSGPTVQLGARAALSTALMVHELATNASKYGSLSAESGRVSVTWRIEGPDLAVEWRERDGPPATEPARTSFGSRLIRMGLAGTGDVVLRYLPAGFEADIRAPLARLQHE